MSKIEDYINSLKNPTIYIHDHYIIIDCCNGEFHSYLDDSNIEFVNNFNKKFDEVLNDFSTHLRELTADKKAILFDKMKTNLFLALHNIDIEERQVRIRVKNEDFTTKIFIHKNINTIERLEEFDTISWFNNIFLSPAVELMHNTIKKIVLFIEEQDTTSTEVINRVNIETFEELIPNEYHRVYLLKYLIEKDLSSEHGTWLGTKEKLACFLNLHLHDKNFYNRKKLCITNIDLINIASNSFKCDMKERSMRSGPELRHKFKADFDNLKSAADLANIASAK